MKRFVLILLAVVLTVALCSCGNETTGDGSSVAGTDAVKQPDTRVGEENSSGDYKYYKLSDGTVEISVYKGDDSELALPDTLDGMKVSVIGEEAFSWNSSIESVSLPATVTHILASAFLGCKRLGTVDLPKSLLVIGDDAFCGLTGLTEVVIPLRT